MAAAILVELVGHDPVVTGEASDLLDGKIEKVLQALGRLQPRHGGAHLRIKRAVRQCRLARHRLEFEDQSAAAAMREDVDATDRAGKELAHHMDGRVVKRHAMKLIEQP